MSTIIKHEILVDRRFYFYKSILQNNKLFLPRNCYYVLYQQAYYHYVTDETHFKKLFASGIFIYTIGFNARYS